MVLAIVRKEILGSGRHARYYAVRGGYLLLLACITIPSLMTAASRLAANPYGASHFGKDFTITFGVLQFVLVVLLAPAFSIGSIANERATGGLDLLHAAGIGGVGIVSGKFAARMAWLALFVASGLPLFFAGTLMGGAGAETVALLGAHCFVAGALATALGFTFSGGMRQTVPALALAYLVLVALYVGVPLALVFYSEGISSSRIPDAWYAWVSPIASVVLFTDGSLPARIAWSSLVPSLGLVGAVLVPSVVFASPSSERGSRSGTAASMPEGRNDPARSGVAARTAWRPKIHGNPIAWRDARAARHGLASHILRIAYFVLGLLVVGGTIAAALGRNMRGKAWTLATIVDALQGDNNVRELSRVALFILIGGAALVALVTASGAIAEERDRRALPLLKLSRLSAGDLVLGKLWGLAVYLWPVTVLPIALAAVFYGVRDPMAVFGTMALLAANLVIATGAGLFFSSFSQKAATAAGFALGVALVYTIVPPIVVEFLRVGRSSQRLLMAIDPLISTIEVLDRFGRSNAWEYGPTDQMLAMGGLVFQSIAGMMLAMVAWRILDAREEA